MHVLFHQKFVDKKGATYSTRQAQGRSAWWAPQTQRPNSNHMGWSEQKNS